MDYYVIVFKNTYDAMKAEDIFNEKKYEYKIMPTPTLTMLSCGICLRIVDETVIKILIEEKFMEYKNIFRREQGEFKLID